MEQEHSSALGYRYNLSPFLFLSSSDLSDSLDQLMMAGQSWTERKCSRKSQVMSKFPEILLELHHLRLVVSLVH